MTKSLVVPLHTDSRFLDITLTDFVSALIGMVSIVDGAIVRLNSVSVNDEFFIVEMLESEPENNSHDETHNTRSSKRPR